MENETRSSHDPGLVVSEEDLNAYFSGQADPEVQARVENRITEVRQQLLTSKVSPEDSHRVIMLVDLLQRTLERKDLRQERRKAS